MYRFAKPRNNNFCNCVLHILVGLLILYLLYTMLMKKKENFGKDNRILLKTMCNSQTGDCYQK